MTSDLSILCVTRADRYAKDRLLEMADLSLRLGAELCIVADGSFAQAQVMQWGLRCDRVRSAGFIESVLDHAIAYASRRYILRLDDDESCSLAMRCWLAEERYLASDHWKFPRQYLWPTVREAIRTEPLFPDFQTRLSVREKSGGRPQMHCGSPFGPGAEAPVAIWHHKFFKDAAERARIAATYDAYQPGFGTGVMLPYSFPERAFQQVVVDDVLDGQMPWAETNPRMLEVQ